MADADLIVRDVQPEQELPPKPQGTPNGGDNGFGLVNWLFDHIKDRKPIFMSLYSQYDNELKLSANYKPLALVFRFMCVIGDLILFAIYAAAVGAVIVAITYIFLKGTGLLEAFHLAPAQSAQNVELQQVQQQVVQDKSQ